MLTKTQKVEFVNDAKKELKKYKVVGVVKLTGIPDRLFQATKNKLKPETRFILGRKTLLTKILEGSQETKELAAQLTNTSAIILSNDDPFALYQKFKSNSIKLSAKPGQIAPEDVSVKSGETNIQPGQTVTELKSAGIDVQIQKGKVVIAKDKVVVKKGDVISLPLAKALRILEVMPFSAMIEPLVLLSDNMRFSVQVLRIDAAQVTSEMSLAVGQAQALSLEAGIVNAYTVNRLLAKAYSQAIYLGKEAKVPDKGIIELLLADATAQASALDKVNAK